jgi:predicted CoA-binding protein
MAKAKLDGAEAHEINNAHLAPEPRDPIEDVQDDQRNLLTTAATVAVVGVGVAVFEAALLPGVVLGVAAMLVPKVLPNVGTAIAPLVRTTVRGAYVFGQKTKEMVAEAQEHVNDIVAEVHAESEAAPLQPAVVKSTSAPAA